MKIAAIVNRKGREFESIGETAPLSEAVQLMPRKKIGSVVIQDGATESVLGILSQQEVTDAIAIHGPDALSIPAALLMRKPAMFCRCEDNAEQVMRAMTRERSRHAVVQTNGAKLAGVVSLRDLVAAMLEQSQLEAGVLRDLARSHLLAMPA